MLLLLVLLPGRRNNVGLHTGASRLALQTKRRAQTIVFYTGQHMCLLADFNHATL